MIRGSTVRAGWGWVGLTAEVGGVARLSHDLTAVVTVGSSPLSRDYGA